MSSTVRTYVRAGRTCYAVTNKRVVILIAGGTGRTVSLGPADIDSLERAEHSDGSTSIRLRQTLDQGSGGSTAAATGFADGLWGIRDAKGAMDAIAALQEARAAEVRF